MNNYRKSLSLERLDEMPAPDPLTIAAVCTAAGSLLTIALTKGITAWRIRRETNHKIEADICHSEDERADSSYKFVIKKLEESNARLDERVSALEAALRQSNTDHLDCERKYERLQGKVEVLEADKRAQGVRIVELESQVSKLQGAV